MRKKSDEIMSGRIAACFCRIQIALGGS